MILWFIFQNLNVVEEDLTKLYLLETKHLNHLLGLL